MADRTPALRWRSRVPKACAVGAICVAWLLGAVAPASAAPTIAAAPPPAPVVLGGGPLSDSVMVSGRVTPNAGATIDFALYGPDDPDCTGTPVFESPDVPYPITDDFVSSGSYVPHNAGTHRWRAAYSGDLNNAAVSTACSDASQARPVLRATPTIATSASPTASVGTSITDTATVDGRVNPLSGATVEFRVYGPDDPTCTAVAIFVSHHPYPTSGGTVTSLAFPASQPGTYRWRAFYSGDTNNANVQGACNEPNEISTVFTPPPPPPPPPPPTEAFVCPPTGLAAGAVYRGTHSQGRAFCFTLSPDFSLVTSYLATGVEGSNCGFDELARYQVGLPIANRAFSDPDGSFAGTFSADRNAQGTLQLSASDGSGTCTTPGLTWTASTEQTPPWVPAPPLPPPPAPPPPPPPPAATIKLSATARQRPLRQGAILVRVTCGARACTARVSATMAAARTRPTARLATLTRRIAARATSRFTMRLNRAARRFFTRALARGRSVRANVTARVTDSSGRVTTKRATIRLTR